MRSEMKWVLNTMPESGDAQLKIMGCANVAAARAFHESFPQYAVTPCTSLARMAGHLGVSSLHVKDESHRFGLNAFKVLGGSFAMARYIAGQTGRPLAECTYSYLTGPELVRDFGQATFFTATDGNHGRGVAWAAGQLGQKAVVHMPKGTTRSRFDNIAALGADVTIEELNYDDCVRLAAAEAAVTEHGVVVQDTAWEGYEEIPAWIMQGYGTMASEAAEQLAADGIDAPTHVLVQAGVGSLAGAVVGYLAHRYADAVPRFIVMETAAADCLYRGACAGDGSTRAVAGDLATIMAGLACGEPNIISWDILRNHADAFVSCPDWMSALGMRMLAAPLTGDPAITSGESGAIGMGVLATIMTDPAYAQLKDSLAFDENSKVLLFSTEGDTDPGRYREIVWGGAWTSPAATL